MSTAMVLLTPLALLGGGSLIETLAQRRDRRRHPPAGELLDVGGHKLHVRVRGDGDPVIVLEAGSGEWSSHWGPLAEQLSAYSTVVTYDRAGLGWSAPGPEPRNVVTLARELHQVLLRTAGERKVILVGHAFGAHVARMYLHRYPFEVAGMVLVDGYQEGLEDVLAARHIPSPSSSTALMRWLFRAGRVGLLRAFRLDPLAQDGGSIPLTERDRKRMRALAWLPRVQNAVLAELGAGAESENLVAQLEERYDIPLRVITSTQTMSAEGAAPGFPIEEFNSIWTQQNAELTKLSSRSAQILATESDHMIQLRSPHLVVQAVREVLAEGGTIPADADHEA
ncbi:MAG: alpha/beta hydrolase [bacterium]|nr:alpha/beta hydrolase [bacterium]